ncbi:MAG: PadR family transcriptional regulator [Acidobacteria bacterium]|nr:PadR family transcriptional regulator [Acidobacteriota bacterium]
MSDRNAHDYLPLRPVEFQILLSLSAGPRHGYRIIQDAEERGEEAAVPGLATLYRALRRLEAEGLIEQSDTASEQDERRRPYRLSGLGVEVARLEARRLASQLGSEAGAALLDPEASR